MKQLNRGSLLDATRQKLWSLDSHLCIRNSRRRRIDYLSESLTWDWAEFLILSRACWIWGLLVLTWIIIHLFIDFLAKILFKKIFTDGKRRRTTHSALAQAPNRVTDLPQARQFPGCKPTLRLPSFVALATKDTNMFKTQRNPKKTQRYLPSMCFHFGRWHIKNRRWFPKGSVWLVWKKGRIPLVGFAPSWCSESACHSGSWT